MIYMFFIINFWMYSGIDYQHDVHQFLKEIDEGTVERKEYDKYIKKIKSTDFSNEDEFNFPLNLYKEFGISFSKAVSRIGPALEKYNVEIRGQLTKEQNINESMLALAMLNDVSSLNYIKSKLYSNDFINQYYALKALMLFSIHENDNLKLIENKGVDFWFLPLERTLKYALTELTKGETSNSPWDIYSFNKKVDDYFWKEVYNCNLATFIDSPEKTKIALAKSDYSELISSFPSLNVENMLIIGERMSKFKAIFQSYNNVVGITKNDTAFKINTKNLKPIFSFEINDRVFLILRGVDSVGFDEIHELINFRENYSTVEVFKLPFSTNKVIDKKEYLSIVGEDWEIDIDKNLSIIKKGKICNQTVQINLGI